MTTETTSTGGGMALTWNQQAAIHILLFIVKMLHPTRYPHEVDALARQIKEARDQ